jgi:hypothetical protein
MRICEALPADAEANQEFADLEQGSRADTNATIITKQASGSAKIDPLTAAGICNFEQFALFRRAVFTVHSQSSSRFSM